jgi:hypothetical protein
MSYAFFHRASCLDEIAGSVTVRRPSKHELEEKTMKDEASISRAKVLEGAPLRYAPANELGVVFLFAHLARKWTLRVDAVRSGFPDCIAYQKVQGKEKRIRIEFEFNFRNFKAHGHRSGQCDWIVCWEHDWPDVPANLQVVELRREFGLGFNVWIVPISDPYKERLEGVNSDDQWSLPSQCHRGDLVLYYLTRPEQSVSHIFVAADRARKIRARWKKGKDYMGAIRRVCWLKASIFFDDFRNHRVLSTAHFVRGQVQGRPNTTEYWPYLYDLIVKRNPSVESKLRKFAPWNV